MVVAEFVVPKSEEFVSFTFLSALLSFSRPTIFKLHFDSRCLSRAMEEETTVEKERIMQNKRICLVGRVADDEAAKVAAAKFQCTVITSATGEELVKDHSWTTYFVLATFEGPEFERLGSTKHK